LLGEFLAMALKIVLRTPATLCQVTPKEHEANVTNLLERAFEEASRFPDVEQNAFAKWMLEELHSERQWAKKFAESEDVLEKLADEALQDKRQGRTMPLDLNRR
jgi:DNA-directed RNA polymerase subunit F